MTQGLETRFLGRNVVQNPHFRPHQACWRLKFTRDSPKRIRTNYMTFGAVFFTTCLGLMPADLCGDDAKMSACQKESTAAEEWWFELDLYNLDRYAFICKTTENKLFCLNLQVHLMVQTFNQRVLCVRYDISVKLFKPGDRKRRTKAQVLFWSCLNDPLFTLS